MPLTHLVPFSQSNCIPTASSYRLRPESPITPPFFTPIGRLKPRNLTYPVNGSQHVLSAAPFHVTSSPRPAYCSRIPIERIDAATECRNTHRLCPASARKKVAPPARNTVAWASTGISGNERPPRWPRELRSSGKTAACRESGATSADPAAVVCSGKDFIGKWSAVRANSPGGESSRPLINQEKANKKQIKLTSVSSENHKPPYHRRPKSTVVSKTF